MEENQGKRKTDEENLSDSSGEEEFDDETSGSSSSAYDDQASSDDDPQSKADRDDATESEEEEVSNEEMENEESEDEALAAVDDIIALQLLSSVDFTRDQLKMLVHHDDPTNPASLRVNFIHFLMSLIIGHSPNVIRKLCNKKSYPDTMLIYAPLVTSIPIYRVIGGIGEQGIIIVLKIGKSDQSIGKNVYSYTSIIHVNSESLPGGLFYVCNFSTLKMQIYRKYCLHSGLASPSSSFLVPPVLQRHVVERSLSIPPPSSGKAGFTWRTVDRIRSVRSASHWSTGRRTRCGRGGEGGTLSRRPMRGQPDPGIVDDEGSIYDPAFLLPVLCQLAQQEHKIKSRMFFQSGAVGLALASLASTSLNIRRLATLFLQRVHKHHMGQDKIVWSNFIDAVRRGIAELEERESAKKKNKSKNTEEEVPRICSITSTFLARASTVLGDPTAPLYRPLHHFILARPALKLFGVPAFLELLHSTDVKYHE
ncbi:unnamed protein product [Nesidiocoris tenuis]|uniref:URB1 C-terminal domain-containing protein n=1 Tax=Nesidiocoris tenuis TaxID=355587 RepID=A0A6H5HH44_9HEMI|nr:unnamed protein product [Nesidiocoris tenuis]